MDINTMRAQILVNQVFPESRFFTGTPFFYEVMLQLCSKITVIECGAGCGDTTAELRDAGISAVAVDIVRRDRQLHDIVIMDATAIKFGAYVWPLICRPDHSGWASKVIKQALAADASAFYVGLPRNYARDMGDLIPSARYTGVGTEGEELWCFSPNANKEVL